MPEVQKSANRGVFSVLRQPTVRRMFLFVLAFVVISGVTGSWVISTNHLLFPFYFGIYGSAGKVLMFSIVVLLLLTKGRVLQVPVGPWTKKNWTWLWISVISVLAFFVVGPQLLNYERGSEALGLTLLAHTLLFMSVGAASLGILGFEYFKQVVAAFSKQLLATLVLAVVFYLLFSYIFVLWPYLSAMVLTVVTAMLKLSYANVVVMPPLTIQLPQFAVTIGEYCSGIESLFLITVLYILIGCLEWQYLRKLRFFLQYLPLIIGMFSLNIIRVYVIIQAGVLLNPEIAAKLFHTYLGMILFMAYFFLFWMWSAPKVIRRSADAGKEER